MGRDFSQAKKNLEGEIDFFGLLDILFDGKWIIISITTFFSIAGVIFSLLLPNIYESKALLASSFSENESGLLQNYGSLANLAGIDIPGSPESNSVPALEKLDSLSFFENNVLPNIFLPNLMAFKSWNSENGSIQYDKDIYDISSDTWVRDFSYPQKLIPSAQESFEKFKKHMRITIDKDTDFVTISVKHQSPQIAYDWTRLLIEQINSFYRKKDKTEAEKAVEYLNTQIVMTNFSEIKESVAFLLQQEIQKLTLIEANEFYVYEYIDPPAVMEEKSEPGRALICILMTFIGGILSTIIVLMKHFIFKEEMD